MRNIRENKGKIGINQMGKYQQQLTVEPAFANISGEPSIWTEGTAKFLLFYFYIILFYFNII